MSKCYFMLLFNRLYEYFPKNYAFFKEKYISIPLLIISILLQLIGIAALIGSVSYQKKSDGRFGSWEYSYELSEKAALDTWEKNTVFYNQPKPYATSSTLVHRTFGEFRAKVNFDTFQDGTETIKAKPIDDDKIAGFLYMNNKKYSAQLNSQTGNIVYDAARSYERPNWQWYHWMGLRPNPFITDVVDTLKSGLTK